MNIIKGYPALRFDFRTGYGGKSGRTVCIFCLDEIGEIAKLYVQKKVPAEVRELRKRLKAKQSMKQLAPH